MRIEYGGLAFDVLGGDAPWGPAVSSRMPEPVFRLRVLHGLPTCSTLAPEDGRPGRVTVDGERVLIHHRRYRAEISPQEGHGVLFHATDDEAGLAGTLGIALAAKLPAVGALPLHASALDVGGAGIVFCGPSGAGKSTVAAASPWPVISDEFTVVREAPWRVLPASPFGPTRAKSPSPEVPLLALISLGKGPRLGLRRLEPPEAFRKVLGSLLVPMTPALWRTATELASRLVRDVPVWRMEWNPAEPPWQELKARLHGLGGEP